MASINNLKIGTRLAGSFLLILLLMLSMGGLSYYGLHEISKETNDAFQTDSKLMEYSARARANVIGLRRYEKDILINIKSLDKVKEYYKKWIEEYNDAVEKSDLALKINLAAKDKETMIKLKDNLKKYHDGFANIYQNILDSKIKTSEEGNKALEEWKDEIHASEKMAKDISYSAVDEMHKMEGMIIMHINETTIRVIIFVCIAILFSIFISIVLTRSITKPVTRGLAFARTFASGDLTTRIDINQKDEIGQLGKELNLAAENIEGLVGNVVLASENLVQAVEQISSGNQNLSQRTSEQASSLEEIASTIEEATASTKQNADNANEANNLTKNTSKLAEEGGRVSTQAVQGINEINDVSKKISDITNVINEISFQTNLLALNAAVEAARAGEAGRGFAVVAGEIRNLAQRSGNAAKEIGTLIKDTITKIETGSGLVNKSGQSLNEIISAITNVTMIVSEINAASSEQKQGMEQLTVAISEMDNMTQQNAALVEETASASEEMANQAQELLALTKKFKTGSGGVSHDVKKEIHIKGAISHSTGMKDIKKSGGDKKPAKVESDLHRIAAEEGFEEF